MRFKSAPREGNGDQGCPWQVTGTRGSENFETILSYDQIHSNSLWSWGHEVPFLEATDSLVGPQIAEEDSPGGLHLKLRACRCSGPR